MQSFGREAPEEQGHARGIAAPLWYDRGRTMTPVAKSSTPRLSSAAMRVYVGPAQRYQDLWQRWQEPNLEIYDASVSKEPLVEPPKRGVSALRLTCRGSRSWHFFSCIWHKISCRVGQKSIDGFVEPRSRATGECKDEMYLNILQH